MTAAEASGRTAEKFAVTFSRNFPEWLAGIKASLAFTTYQAGKLFLLGLKPDGRLAVFERSFAWRHGHGCRQQRGRAARAFHAAFAARP